MYVSVLAVFCRPHNAAFPRRGDSPREQVDELWLGHPVRQDARDGSDTRPEQVNLGLSFTSVKVRLYSRFDCKSLLSMCSTELGLGLMTRLPSRVNYDKSLCWYWNRF